MKHLLSVADLTAESATEILDEAERFEQALLGREVKKLPTLRGRTIMTVFFENSTRTRVSFEVAGKWMSADVINVSASSSSVSKGESLRDTAMTLRAAGADALIVRHPASGAAHQIAQWTADQGTGLDGRSAGSTPGLDGRSAGSTPGGGPAVINAGDGTHEHPTQALLDALTVRQRLGDIAGRRVAIVGDILHSRVARSNAILLATLGAEVVLIAPPTLLPVGVTGWPVRVSHDIDAELPGLDAVLMLRVQAERMNGGFFPSAREYSITYGLSQRRLDLLPEHAVVLHPGPMLRGMEIASSVADSPKTAVLQQVTNGVHVRMAVLFRLLVGSDGGAS
ncbi:aspartate carbamoyltransferase catalytic subunit [Rhodococcus cerastii]|jgi:aspartate carbamoyltransferase catalytic subunit|uniref:Aspartate carbamoyltransferase n=2 Tax=Rhodococcus TaxID=1827 RepID=A0ABU4ATD2_9NOCA|nr:MULTISPECIES: aspartate carbamoyltransferase catalytic subunit [Rhodococcus]KAA0926503.1 aspartate carbamoyltransferase catalytic subunit [Rhodococcus sp. ANT_H53B]MDI9924679.1 aspartate carbamoyltransferase catalytic subunit [Rhodococcus sp. IEGM 1341]MDV6229499.1 aspartate carbamoyltransferase catalytic subunit [Rhodococcus cercidiphylli]MDV6303300.1 aspartate carbamoyltransferase catalytic subunit [Rhodococcus cerastii]